MSERASRSSGEGGRGRGSVGCRSSSSSSSSNMVFVRPDTQTYERPLQVIAWRRLVNKRPLQKMTRGYHTFEAYLRQPEGLYVQVFYKMPKRTLPTDSSTLQQEAKVLRAIQGTRGVPTLYGLTRPPNEALIMSYCVGNTLGHYLTKHSPRTYLAAMCRLCHVLQHVHARGVAHRNLQTWHVFVTTDRHTEQHDTTEVQVTVAGFNKGTLNATPIDIALDATKIANMAFAVHNYITVDHVLLHPRRYLLHDLKQQSLALHGIVHVLSRVLYGEQALSRASLVM